MSYQRSFDVSALGMSLLLACVFWANTAPAQSSSQNPPTASSSSSASDEGKEIGGFQVTQSIEVGGRISNVSGSQPMYDTLVNDQSGLRILEQSLIMQSISHQDVFDTLTLNSFGWGGDPEQAARVRVSKYRWYTFSGSYQHMQNYFDYDLFANPLNPPTGSPPLPILNSPHGYYNRQNLYNFDLVVLPMHRVSFRLDYNRNRFDGPAFSSIHEGTEAQLTESTDNTLNGFRFGVDVRATKKTTLSYTQLLQYYDGGTTYGLSPFNSWPLSNGTPVSLGLSWFNSGSPCSMPLMNGVANPTCNGFLNYSLDQHINTFIPTEQFNLASSSIKHLDFNGQFQYSHAQMNTPFTEVFSGLTSRTASLGSNTTGSNSSAKWNSASADVSATYHISDKFRLVETFRFRNFSVSGNYLDLQTNYFAAAGTSGSLLTPVATFPPGLSHSSNSPADIINELNVSMIAQNMKQNDFQVQYDVSRWFGVRVGFDWDNYTIQPGDSAQTALGDIYYPTLPNRGDCAGLPLNPDGSCTLTGVIVPWGSPTTTETNDYSGVLGVWFRKGNTLHANLNAKFGGADNWIYRIDPLSSFNISGNISYSPHPWLTVGANLKFQQGKNNVSDINYNQHNYSTVLNAMINPNKYWGLEVAYNFDAIQQNMFLCFAGTMTPADTTTCPEDPSLMQTYGFYHTHTQFGYFALTLTPIQRVTLHLGYTMVDNQGNTTSLNTLQPLGPLSSTYQSPLAALEVGVHKDVTFKAAWNYYQYGEGSFVGPTAPRYFHANNTMLALRYAF